MIPREGREYEPKMTDRTDRLLNHSSFFCVFFGGYIKRLLIVSLFDFTI